MEFPTAFVTRTAHDGAPTPPYNRIHAESLASDPEYLAEDMALDLTEDISRIMQFRGLTKAELARAMGVTRAYVTRMLNAPPNMTLRTIATVGVALGVQPRIVLPHTITANVLWPRHIAQPALPGLGTPQNPRILLVADGKDDGEWTYPPSFGTTSLASGEP